MLNSVQHIDFIVLWPIGYVDVERNVYVVSICFSSVSSLRSALRSLLRQRTLTKPMIAVHNRFECVGIGSELLDKNQSEGLTRMRLVVRRLTPCPMEGSLMSRVDEPMDWA